MTTDSYYQQDVIFDALAERFERKIYGSDKGELRLTLLWDDLCATVPALQGNAALTVLDAGAGLGQIGQRIAALGHRVTLAEPSQAMLERAQALMAAAVAKGAPVDFLLADIRQLPALLGDKQFDLVVCHAVLEWLAQPQHTLTELLRCLRPGAYLSLAFYNRESIVWKNLLKGNLRKLRRGKLAGDRGSLTPINPQSPPEVISWLQDAGLEIVAVTGIRCLHDYLYPGVSLPAAELLAIERELSRREPYKWLGRYIHVMARQPA